MTAHEGAASLGGAVQVTIATLSEKTHPAWIHWVSGIRSQVVEVRVSLGAGTIGCRYDQHERHDRKQNPDSMCCHRDIPPKWPTAQRSLPGSGATFHCIGFRGRMFPVTSPVRATLSTPPRCVS